MKIKIVIAGLLSLLSSGELLAQKEIYIPNQMYEEGYSETDESQQWCKIRSRESDNIIVFWANGYGQNDPNSGFVPSEYRVDIDDLLKKLESFYDLYIHQLKFAEVRYIAARRGNDSFAQRRATRYTATPDGATSRPS